MFTRWLYAPVHLLFGTQFLIGGAIALVQGELNLRWESAFYASSHPHTLALTLAGVFLVLWGGLEVIIGAGLAFQASWALVGNAILFALFALLVALANPSLLATALFGVLALHAIIVALPPAPPSEDDPEDD